MWINSHCMAPSLSYYIHVMQLIISPAKTMTDKSLVQMGAATKPLFQHEAEEIAWHMTHLSTEELKRSLKLSPKLALINAFRTFMRLMFPAYKPYWLIQELSLSTFIRKTLRQLISALRNNI